MIYFFWNNFFYLALRVRESAQNTILAQGFFMKCTLSSKHKISMDIGPKINSSRISNLDMILLDQFFLFGPPSPGRCPNHDSCASIFLESQGEISCFNGFHCTHGLISTQMMFGDENARVCIQIPVEKRSEVQNACEPHNPYAWWIGRTPLSHNACSLTHAHYARVP